MKRSRPQDDVDASTSTGNIKRQKPEQDKADDNMKRANFEEEHDEELRKADMSNALPDDHSTSDVCFISIASCREDEEEHEIQFEHFLTKFHVNIKDIEGGHVSVQRSVKLKDISSLLQFMPENPRPGKSYLFYKHKLSIFYNNNDVTKKGYINVAKMVRYTHENCMRKYKSYQEHLALNLSKIPAAILKGAQEAMDCDCIVVCDLSSFAGLFAGELKSAERLLKCSAPQNNNTKVNCNTFTVYNLIINNDNEQFAFGNTNKGTTGITWNRNIQLPNLMKTSVTHLSIAEKNKGDKIGYVSTNVQKQNRVIANAKDGIKGIFQIGDFIARIDETGTILYLSCKKVHLIHEYTN